MNKAYVFAGIAIFFWSTVAVTTKLLLTEHNNVQVLWISALFAAVFLLVVNVATGNIQKLKAYSVKDYLVTVAVGLPGTFLYHIFYYGGTDRMLASQAFIVNYLWPIMSVVFACILLKEQMTLRKGLAIVLSFLGVVLVTGGALEHLSTDMLVGTLLCICGAVSYGVFTALNQKVHYDKRISLMLNYFVTFLLTSVINAVNGDLFVPTLPEMLGFAWNGIFTMAVATTMWVLALASGKTAKISNLAYITPFLSLVWTSCILKEPLNIYFVVGLLVIVLGILIQFRDGQHAERKQI